LYVHSYSHTEEALLTFITRPTTVTFWSSW